MDEKKRDTDWGTNFKATGSNLLAIRHLVADGKAVKGHQFREIRIQWKEESLLIVLKKDSPKGPQIAFIEGNTLEDAVFIMASMIKAKQVPWKEDKWKMREIVKNNRT